VSGIPGLGVEAGVSGLRFSYRVLVSGLWSSQHVEPFLFLQIDGPLVIENAKREQARAGYQTWLSPSPPSTAKALFVFT